MALGLSSESLKNPEEQVVAYKTTLAVCCFPACLALKSVPGITRAPRQRVYLLPTASVFYTYFLGAGA